MSPLDGMEVAGFVEHLTSHCQEQFPYSCPSCAVSYQCFQDYLRGTRPIGLQCFDMAHGRAEAFGTLSLANCRCGTTLSLACSDTGSEMYAIFISAIERDASEHGISINEVLERLRGAVHRQALQSAHEVAAVGLA